jgi:hypothetical protein
MCRKLFASSFLLKSPEIETLSEPAVRRQSCRFTFSAALTNRIPAASSLINSLAQYGYSLVSNNVPVLCAYAVSALTSTATTAQTSRIASIQASAATAVRPAIAQANEAVNSGQKE